MNNLALVLLEIYPDLDIGPDPENDVILNDTGSGPFIAQWNDARPQPSQAELDASNLIVLRQLKINELKVEGLARVNAVYGDEVFASVGAVKLLLDIENTYDRSGAVAQRLVDVNQLLTTYETAVVTINGLNQAGVDAYDVSVDPGWP